jgi:hypothetical protein
MDNGPVPGRVRRASGHQLKPATRTRRRAAAAGMLSALLLLSGPGGASAGDAGIGTLIGPARVVDGGSALVGLRGAAVQDSAPSSHDARSSVWAANQQAAPT